MQELEAYLKDFLNSEHPYRKGSVCPFMKKVLDDNQLSLSKLNPTAKGYSLEARRVITEFITLSSKQVFVLQFPAGYALGDAKKIARKMRIKASFGGYMIGAFGPGEQTPSLHSPNFFPFRPDQVIIVVRIMVPHDTQFFSHASFITSMAMKEGYKKRSQKDYQPSLLRTIVELLERWR